jgi:hypothetical protein
VNKEVTVVITSADRHDLLEQTLDSFVRCNTCAAAKRIIIIEDSCNYPHFVEEKPLYKDYDIYILNHRPRLGQLLSIDVAYKYVKTGYIFHCEDDWEFYAPGFIESSMLILDYSPHILQVHLRKADDVFTVGKLEYTLEKSGALAGKFALIEKGTTSYAEWYGFSFNPGLRRLSDYTRLGGYSPQLLTTRYIGEHYESYIGTLYHEQGYKAAISLFNNSRGFVRHIGDKRHVY